MDWQEVPIEVVRSTRKVFVIDGRSGTNLSDREIAEEIVRMNESPDGPFLDWGQGR